MATSKVDPTALADLARRLGRAHGDLLALERHLGHYADDAGDPRLVERLHELAANWSEARGQIGAELEALASLASSAASAYADQERILAAGFAETVKEKRRTAPEFLHGKVAD